MSYHAGLGRGDIGGPERLRVTSGSGPAVPPFGHNSGMGSGTTSGMTYVSGSTGMASGGGTFGVNSSSRGLQSQTWGTGPPANSDTGEALHHRTMYCAHCTEKIDSFGLLAMVGVKVDIKVAIIGHEVLIEGVGCGVFV